MRSQKISQDLATAAAASNPVESTLKDNKKNKTIREINQDRQVGVTVCWKVTPQAWT